tara:strand:- start:546 stop:746 length:201 start_codon:yes stop_codon:yes gene_type:complete
MQTTPLLQSERVGEKEKMNKYNIRFNLEEDTPRYISSMSGGLEHKLAKIYRKIINKLLKYKKNIFE